VQDQDKGKKKEKPAVKVKTPEKAAESKKAQS